MLIKRFLGKIRIRLRLAKLVTGSVLTALTISLGMIGILKLVGFPMNPVVPAVMGVVGATAYAARVQCSRKP